MANRRVVVADDFIDLRRRHDGVEPVSVRPLLRRHDWARQNLPGRQDLRRRHHGRRPNRGVQNLRRRIQRAQIEDLSVGDLMRRRHESAKSSRRMQDLRRRRQHPYQQNLRGAA